MKQYINEHKRWQKLAGIISEMKVTDPARFDIGDKVYDINEQDYVLYTITNKVENAEELESLGVPYMVDWDTYDINQLNDPWYELDGNDWFPKNELTRKLNEYKVNNPGNDFNLEDAFNKSPQYHSYNDVLELIKSYDDEDILFDFKDVFPENGIISKEDYISFTSDYIDDLSEAGMNKANWVSISDPDVFRKAKLI